MKKKTKPAYTFSEEDVEKVAFGLFKFRHYKMWNRKWLRISDFELVEGNMIKIHWWGTAGCKKRNWMNEARSLLSSLSLKFNKIKG